MNYNGLTHYLCIAAFVFAPDIICAEEIEQIDYTKIPKESSTYITFEGINKKKSGFEAINDPFEIESISFGERFVGQQVSILTNSSASYFDKISGEPVNPLEIQLGESDRNLSVEWKSAFKSSVLAGVGRDGVQEGSGSGEGALALLSKEDFCQFGFKTELDVDNESEARLAEFGKVRIFFYRRDGSLLDEITVNEKAGTYKFGFSQVIGLHPSIAGILIENLDRGGISVDNLKINVNCHEPS